MEQQRRTGYRSLFWPVLLIGIGLVWLLSNMGVLSFSLSNLEVLLRLWPIILIVLGLDILFGRRSPIIGGLLGVAAAALVIWLVFTGPALGLVREHHLDTTTEQFSEDVGDATSARIDLNLPVGETSVYALSDSNKLIEAEMTHAGQVQFTATTDGPVKTVRLLEELDRVDFDMMFGFANRMEDLHSDIGLSRNVPLDLDISLDVSSAKLDLSALQLSRLSVAGDVGQVDLILPAMEDHYKATVRGDVGGFTIEIPQATDIDLDITGNIGGFEIDVPEGAGVQLQASVDVGGIDVPGHFIRTRGGGDDFVGQSGTWETPNFTEAEHQIRIVFRGDVGGLEIH